MNCATQPSVKDGLQCLKMSRWKGSQSNAMNPLANEAWRRDVFILGAGFSHAVSNELPLTRDLFALCRQAMLKLGAEVLEDKDVMDSYARFGENVETWLTWLGSDQPWLNDIARWRNRAAFGEVAVA